MSALAPTEAAYLVRRLVTVAKQEEVFQEWTVYSYPEALEMLWKQAQRMVGRVHYDVTVVRKS